MRKNTGFTLMEVMMVIAIIGVLCAIATPNLVKWLPRHRVGSAARDVMSALEFARLNAIKANGAVTLTFDFTGDRLTVVDSGGTTLRTLGMPADVDLDNFGLGGSVTFSGHGFSTASGRVIVQNTNNAAINRSINLTMGGNASIH
jgi:prepilin-type N-terminal cleavage/methylation domain-containing protein